LVRSSITLVTVTSGAPGAPPPSRIAASSLSPHALLAAPFPGCPQSIERPARTALRASRRSRPAVPCQPRHRVLDVPRRTRAGINSPRPTMSARRGRAIAEPSAASPRAHLSGRLPTAGDGAYPEGVKQRIMSSAEARTISATQAARRERARRCVRGSARRRVSRRSAACPDGGRCRRIPVVLSTARPYRVAVHAAQPPCQDRDAWCRTQNTLRARIFPQEPSCCLILGRLQADDRRVPRKKISTPSSFARLCLPRRLAR